MSKADYVFRDLLLSIRESGTNCAEELTRAKWEDGMPAWTFKSEPVCHTYDLREEFPIITARGAKNTIRNCAQEIIWIYQKKSNNVKDLGLHIWDAWADENGSIGKSYGWQIANKKTILNGKELDQMDYVLELLTTDPMNRGILTSVWDFEDLTEMNLRPCAYSMTYTVTIDEKGKKVLNGVLMQRSNDLIVANSWNVSQYAILLMMVARHCNMIPGKLFHMIVDPHVYNRHIPIADELIANISAGKVYDAPRVFINPNKTNFYDITVDDIIVENYKYTTNLGRLEVAI